MQLTTEPLKIHRTDWTQPLITPSQRKQLMANGHQHWTLGQTIDPQPVARLFTLTSQRVWLLTELMPSDPDLFWGALQLKPTLEPLVSFESLMQLERHRDPAGYLVQVDPTFRATKPLSAYLAQGLIT